MFIILWEYRVKPEKQSEFESIYSPTGTWTVLFNKSTGYAGTELLRDESRPNRYLIIDRWTTRKDHQNFMRQYENEYRSLGVRYQDLAESESLIGKWETIDT